MNIYRLVTFILLCLFIDLSNAQNNEMKIAWDNFHRYSIQANMYKASTKEKEGIEYFRDLYSRVAYRSHELYELNLSIEYIVSNLQDDGRFTDMIEEENNLNLDDQNILGLFLGDAFRRIWKIAEEFRAGRINYSRNNDLFKKCQKAILYYGNIEISRKNVNERFHSSCFMIPTCAVNTYFCFFKEMEKVEQKESDDKLLIETSQMLKIIGLQAWTQPLRNDYTDNNVVQIDRFRKHVWWVGGNALAYRSLLPVAAMYGSVPMMNVLSKVCKECLSGVSQNTLDKAFWTEGCTEDGAGWGHGMQCLIWGYPIDGNLSALNLMTSFKGTCWEEKLDEKNKYYLMNFIRGSNWYYYKGYQLPFLHRGTFSYLSKKSKIRSLFLVNTLLTDWSDSFDEKEIKELEKFKSEAQICNINMQGFDDGVYSGTRWFFNNDDLIKKNDKYHIIVNMASKRCDGLESAPTVADGYNFFPCDGMTLFQKDGNEYYKVFGAWDVTFTPGVTSREGMDKLIPVTNWRGYCSKYNFAGAATNGGENAVAGFIFEKMNASEKDYVNDKGDNIGKNQSIYGVKAYKSYFMFNDYFLALGAGVKNLTPDISGKIYTTIDQTLNDKPLFALQEGKQFAIKEGTNSLIVNGKPVWVIQKGRFAYSVLPQYTNNAYFEYSRKKTNWIKYNQGNKNKKSLPDSVDILSLWINHGQYPDNETYGYVVYSGNDIPDKNLPVEVLRNDTLIQAIVSNDRRIVEAVFYDAKEELKIDSYELSVSAPCVVLVDNNKITIVDPTMNPEIKEIIVSYNKKRYSFKMPQGGLCGKPVTISIDH